MIRASLCCIKLIKGRKFLGGILNLSKTEKKHPPAIYFPFLELSLLLNNHLLKMDIFSVFTRYPSFLAFLSSFSLMLCLHLITRSYVFIKFTYWRVTDGKRIPLRIKSILSETVDLPKSRTFSMTFAKRTWFFAGVKYSLENSSCLLFLFQPHLQLYLYLPFKFNYYGMHM